MEKKVVVIPVSELIPGMIAARDVYSRSDQLLIPADSEVDNKGIAKITFFGIMSIAVYMDEDVIIDDPIAQVTDKMTEGERTVHRFEMQYDNSIRNISESLNSLLEKGREIDEVKLINEVETLVTVTNNKYQVMDMLRNIQKFDDETYRHSVNVAMICNVFAEWLGMSDYEKKYLTLCGILHDFGKLMVNREVLRKPGRLTEEEYKVIKEHPVMGYEYLRNQNINESVKKAVLLHHERSDGTGYPFGMTRTQIDPFAAITAIADVYEAMTANRVYRDGLCPFEVIRLFEQEGKQQFNPIFLIPILKKLTDTYLQHDVQLSDGRTGRIILINSLELSRPSILCDGKMVDLTKERGIAIEKVL